MSDEVLERQDIDSVIHNSTRILENTRIALQVY